MPRQQLTHDAVISVITDDQSRRDLQAYFGEALEQPSPRDYTGGRFDLLGGGGDREAIKNEITAEDLIAVQFLSVTVPQVVALDLLEGISAAMSAGISRQSRHQPRSARQVRSNFSTVRPTKHGAYSNMSTT